ncbi:hypothetical protein GOP47_0024352 [Adiantum capillus-veneris]|uniref:Inositol polyphosphate multikinase n=1 Tax=Adiantum capillus-veneris TaxID=13818 RepID=A0A9D4Z4B0_ADICA|nr:hypothetical protein GOP47_0024352 [Adiantum capillus-veneris]
MFLVGDDRTEKPLLETRRLTGSLIHMGFTLAAVLCKGVHGSLLSVRDVVEDTCAQFLLRPYRVLVFTPDHLCEQDLTQQFQRPCVIDLKMGVHTWYPGASEQYIAKCKEKDAESTSKDLGFRVSGLQAFDTNSGNSWKPGRIWCKTLDANATKLLLKQFVSSNPTDDMSPDCTYASAVYAGEDGIIKQLSELRSWFAVQTSYHFFSSSILLMYESNGLTQDGPAQESMHGTVKLVDFAHVLMDQEAADENFLQGLDSLIAILCEIAGLN